MMSNSILMGTGCILALVILWKIIRYPHAWELVDKTEFPPSIEVYKQAGGYHLHHGFLSTEAAERMCCKTVVLALRCPKCGRAMIKKITG